MKKVLVATLTLGVLLTSTTAFASVEKGQKLYLKACKSCHGNGTKGAAMKSQAGWDKAFANDAKDLVAAHQKDPKAKPYFDGAFKGHMNDLHEFLKEYGNDSGNVPACG